MPQLGKREIANAWTNARKVKAIQAALNGTPIQINKTWKRTFLAKLMNNA